MRVVAVPDVKGRKRILDEAEELCRARGGRFTQQRRTVLSKLLAAGRPVSAYELVELVRPLDAAITPASVYRSLDFLVEIGLVHRLDTTKSFVACDHPDHPHAAQFLICRECGTVVETNDGRIARATGDLGERHGFTVDQRTVELTGLCGSCRGDAPASKSGQAARG